MVQGSVVPIEKEGYPVSSICVEAESKNGPHKFYWSRFFMYGRYNKAVADLEWDLSLIVCGADGRMLEDGLVFYNNYQFGKGLIEYDDAAYIKDRRLDRFTVDLQALPLKADKIVVVLTINDRPREFGCFEEFDDLTVRIVDPSSGTEVCSYALSEGFEGKEGILAGEIKRGDLGGWVFEAVGSSVEGPEALAQFMEMYK